MSGSDTAESRWVQAHGLHLHYLDWGNEGAPPVLLLHGLQDSAALWGTFAEGMRERFHVMALDHRGHGDSPRAESYALADYVRETAEVIEALDLRGLALMGHSAGSKNAFIHVANQAADHAADYPGRVSRLVITDMDPDSYNPGSVAMISRYKGEGDEYDDMAAVIERLRSRQPAASEAVMRASADALITPLPDGRLTWKRSRDIVTKYDRPDAWDYLPRVAVPTLIVRGADSPLLVHDVAVRMQAAIPDCRLVEIPGGGHWVHLERPDDYLRVVSEFLAG